MLFSKKPPGVSSLLNHLLRKLLKGFFHRYPHSSVHRSLFEAPPLLGGPTGSNWEDPPSSTVCSCLLFLGEGGSGLFGVCELWSGFLVPYLEMERKLESRLNIFQV